jgi:hypothetical protein
MTSSILRRGPSRFNMVGQKLPDSLQQTDQTIPTGLLDRLHRYGLRFMEESGFDVTSWSCEIYTTDGDLPSAERMYCVEFTNHKGGMLGVQGIMIGKGGHPCLDHGLSCDIRHIALGGTAA